MFLYEAKLPLGKANPNWQAFYNNVSELNAQAPDYGGINNVAILKHHINKEAVRDLCMANFKGKVRDVEVNEITASTLNGGDHQLYIDTVNKYFRRHDSFPNLERS